MGACGAGTGGKRVRGARAPGSGGGGGGGGKEEEEKEEEEEEMGVIKDLTRPECHLSYAHVEGERDRPHTNARARTHTYTQ